MNGHARPQHRLRPAAWRKTILLALAGAGISCATTVQAHHSFAMFDPQKTLTIVGRSLSGNGRIRIPGSISR